MPAFRERATVEAYQLTADNGLMITAWVSSYGLRCQDGTQLPIGDGPPVRYLVIWTADGQTRADVGDWIVRDAQNWFTRLGPAAFAATYEPAGDSTR